MLSFAISQCHSIHAMMLHLFFCEKLLFRPAQRSLGHFLFAIFDYFLFLEIAFDFYMFLAAKGNLNKTLFKIPLLNGLFYKKKVLCMQRAVIKTNFNTD